MAANPCGGSATIQRSGTSVAIDTVCRRGNVPFPIARRLPDASLGGNAQTRETDTATRRHPASARIITALGGRVRPPYEASLQLSWGRSFDRLYSPLNVTVCFFANAVT